jgi:hypothetical protein
MEYHKYLGVPLVWEQTKVGNCTNVYEFLELENTKDRLGNEISPNFKSYFLVGEKNKTKEKLLDPRLGKLG